MGKKIQHSPVPELNTCFWEDFWDGFLPQQNLGQTSNSTWHLPSSALAGAASAMDVPGLKGDSLTLYFGMPGCQTLCSAALSRAVAPLHKYVYGYAGKNYKSNNALFNPVLHSTTSKFFHSELPQMGAGLVSRACQAQPS